jgi:hypothetical protein
MRPVFDYDQEFDEPYEFVATEPHAGDPHVPFEYEGRILIDTVHDGGAIPKKYRFKDGVPLVDPEELNRSFVRERDWGANEVAHHLASSLGIPGYYRVRLARVLMDFNRFPGTTPPGSDDPMARLAINSPFAMALDHPQKIELLENNYDGISRCMEPVLEGKLIKIGVHTYDEHNKSLTRRPDVSLITRSLTYQRESRMPFGVFDPLYPDVLGESTCSRTLRDRVSLNLERAGFRVGHNHPYLLPEGSVEVRTQVYYFFQFLRRCYEDEFPETLNDPAHETVWIMLLNTNLRRQESEELQGYLHRYRRVADPSRRALFEAARLAYERLRSFMREAGIATAYRRSHDRPSSMVIEVRKDLLSRFDDDGRIVRPVKDNAQQIARVIAGAIAIFLETDRQVPEEGRSARLRSASIRAQEG